MLDNTILQLLRESLACENYDKWCEIANEIINAGDASLSHLRIKMKKKKERMKRVNDAGKFDNGYDGLLRHFVDSISSNHNRQTIIVDAFLWLPHLWRLDENMSKRQTDFYRDILQDLYNLYLNSNDSLYSFDKLEKLYVSFSTKVLEYKETWN